MKTPSFLVRWHETYLSIWEFGWREHKRRRDKEKLDARRKAQRLAKKAIKMQKSPI